MTYDEAIDFIMSHRKFQKTDTHERIETLLSLLDSPHKKLKFVHIVGTNGKGSTSTVLASILKNAGYTTGLFTSPYVVEFGERIQVNGEYIPKEDIADIVSLIKEKTELMAERNLYPTVFEVTTALAMVHFLRKKCEIVFLEAGIGGMHDSTNVIPSPLAAVFTAISLDHTEMLGDTVEKIAKEKCGIIKEGTTVVSYPFESGNLGFIPQKKDAVEVIRKESQSKNCSLRVPNCSKAQILRNDIGGSDFVYEETVFTTRLSGLFQVGNILTAIETVKALRAKGFSISEAAVKQGVFDFTIPARTEIVSENPLVILDGGHNEASISVLASTVKTYLADKKVTMLLSFMKDKDYETCLQIIAPFCETVVFTEADKIRGEKSEILCKKAKDLFRNAYCEPDVDLAYEKALSLTDKNGALIVAGSFYLASHVRNRLLK